MMGSEHSSLISHFWGLFIFVCVWFVWVFFFVLMFFVWFFNMQPNGSTLPPQILKSECLTFSLGILKN